MVLNMFRLEKRILFSTIMMLLVLIMGSMSINRLVALDEATAALHDDYFPSVMWVSKLAISLSDVRRWQSRYVLAGKNNTAEQNRIRPLLNSAITETDEASKSLEYRLDAGEENSAFQTQFAVTWPLYRGEVQETVRLMNTGQTQNANELWNGISKDDFFSLIRFVRWEMKYNQQAGMAAANRSRSECSFVEWIIAGGMTLSSGFVMTLLFYTGRSIRVRRRQQF